MLPRSGVMADSTLSPIASVTNGATSNSVRERPAAAKPWLMGSSSTADLSGSIQMGNTPSATSAAACTPRGVMFAA